jgi:hypothetical protein
MTYRPFKQVVVVLTRNGNQVLEARIRQGSLLGTNLLPRQQLTSVESAKKVLQFLLETVAQKIEFMEE